MEIALWHWGGFAALVIVLLSLDLLVFHRHDHEPSLWESAGWSAFWISTGLAFNAVLWWYDGALTGQTFLAAFLMEKALSMDNIFVFVVIFRFFAVPLKYQYRVLFWGILGAVGMRLAFILAGVELIHLFNWIMVVFGLFLIYTAYKLVRHSEAEVNPENNIVLKLGRRWLPVSRGGHEEYGHDFFTRENGLFRVTPLFLVLLVIESTDVLFAVDSVPAVIGVIPKTLFTPAKITFLAFASNVFAILGLRALYFLLAGMVDVFRFLHYGLAAILGFVGLKMLAEYWMELQGIKPMPVWVSLAAIGALLAISIVASIAVKPSKPDEGLT